MKSTPFCVFAAAAVIVLLGAAVCAGMHSASYSIPRSVVCAGGADASSAGYRLTSTIGQPCVVGLSAKTGYICYAGFWHPEALAMPAQALPWLPLLLLGQ